VATAWVAVADDGSPRAHVVQPAHRGDAAKATTVSLLPVTSATEGPCTQGDGGYSVKATAAVRAMCFHTDSAKGMRDIRVAAAKAENSTVDGGWHVEATLSSADRTRFATLTGSLASAPPPRNQFAIIIDGKLWGMISCHNSTPRSVPFIVRSACDVLTRITASQISADTRAAEFADAIRAKALERDLLTFMALEERHLDGIVNHPEKLMALTKSSGAALIFDDSCILMGDTPSEEHVKMLGEWVAARESQDLFISDHLSADIPNAEPFIDVASGMLAITLSQVHRFQILWFRPEILRTVHWAGEPQVSKSTSDGTLQISPRLSFASWSELVRHCSEPWSKTDIQAARDFRNAVMSIVLRRAEELADIAAELEFTNKELEAFSYSVSHDLRAPFRHISGFAELLLTDEKDRLSERGQDYLNRISQSAQFAGQLVDSLLNFSKIARAKLDLRSTRMSYLVREVWNDVVTEELQDRQIEFVCGELPKADIDIQLMRQAWRNLLSNAAKYTKTRPLARVEVAATRDHHQYIFSIRDNGVGFDNRYVGKLFGAFQRLHRMEDFEGTGIGLANVRRIVSRHGGQTWAEGRLNEGATFFFSLPVPEPPAPQIN